MAGMGHRREDLTPYQVLFRAVGAYPIVYRGEYCGEFWPELAGFTVTPEGPGEIFAVTQGSRDIPSFLRRRH